MNEQLYVATKNFFRLYCVFTAQGRKSHKLKLQNIYTIIQLTDSSPEKPGWVQQLPW